MEDNGQSLHIVAIGASAGGLEALQQVLSHLPELDNTAFIIAQHLSPTYKSRLVELLSKATKLNVTEARNNSGLEPHTVYITPPDSDITIRKNTIILTKPSAVVGPRPSVDVLLRSLAGVFDQKITAIILSGTGKDGAQGITLLSGENTFIIVQNPKTAKYDGMPNAALDTGLVDSVLAPEDIGAAIKRFLEDDDFPVKRVFNKDEKSLQSFETILQILTERTGTNFSGYKKGTLMRRLSKRMQNLNIQEIESYVQHLKKTPGEIEEMVNMILIGVTQFFRDKEAFKALEGSIKELITEKKSKHTIRIWVPGCSTGEEAYSIAILTDILSSGNSHFNVQIFATDIDERAIQFARRATYSTESLQDVPQDILQRYFIQKDDTYELTKQIRSKVLFSRHDITQNPPFLRIDLISCRNLLIYFDNALQKYIMPVFHYSLNPDGILFLGKSETIGTFTDLFKSVDPKNRIFQRKSVESIHALRFSAFSPKIIKRLEKKELPASKSVTITDRIKETLFKSYEHPYVVVDTEYNIQDVFGDVRLFISLSTGSIQVNLLKMVNPELQIELRSLLALANSSKEGCRGSIKKFTLFGKVYYVRITVKPLVYGETHQSYFIVIFEDLELDAFMGNDGPDVDEDHHHRRTNDLERELEATKEQLQTYIEELETSNEELQSLNEELQSTNEELQTSNEELETTNEELQSTNEEIQITYTELKSTYEQLSEKEQAILTEQAHSKALLNNNLQGFILIDKGYQIVDYNPRAAEIMGQLGTNDFRNQTLFLDYLPQTEVGTFVSLFKGVIKDDSGVKVIEREIELELGEGKRIWLLVSITPVIDLKNENNSLTIGLLDITERKTTHQKLQHTKNRLESLLNAQTHYVLRTDMQGRYTYWNDIFEQEYGWLHEDTGILGTSSMESICEHDHEKAFLAVQECVAEPGTVVKVELDKPAIDGGIRTTLWEFMCVNDEQGVPVEMQCMGIEITYLKQLQKSEQQFKTLFNDSPVSLIIHDKETGDVLDANETAWKSYGFNTIKDLQKNDFWIEPPYSEKEALEWIRKAANDGKQQFEWKKRKVTGEEFWEYVTLRPIVIHGVERILAVAIDITGRKLAELQLQKLSTAVTQSPASIVITDIEGTIEYVNPKFAELTGYSQEEAIGKNPRILNSGTFPKSFYKEMWVTITAGNVWRGELLNKKKNGKLYWEDATISPVFDTEGNIVNYLAVKEDITEKKEIENKLLESEQRFRTIFETLPVISVQGYDQNRNVIYWNKASEIVYGYTKEEAMGEKIEELIIPDEMKTTVKRDIQSWIEHGKEISSAELTLKRKDGEPVYVYSNHVMIENPQGEKELYCIDVDLTELKQTERELRESELYHRSLLQTIPDMVFVLTNEGVLTDYHAFDKDDLYMKADGFLNKHIEDFLPLEICQKQTAAIEKCHKYKVLVNFEYTLEINQENRYYSAKTVSFGNDKVLVTVRDISEYQRNLDRIQQLLISEGKLNENLRSFTHIVSHNLRIHTANMQGILMLMEDTEPELYENQFVQMLKESSENLEETISDLNEVLNIRLDTQAVVKKINLHKTIENAIAGLNIDAKEKGVKIINNVPPGFVIYAVPSYLNSIMLNLLSNGIKYRSKESESWIDISAESNDIYTKIKIKDNGLGIDLARHREKLFTMYKKFHDSPESKGFGLFITKIQVEAMGGYIEVESELHKGSTFIVSIPNENN